jgi:AcrR family transcriptional regulator
VERSLTRRERYRQGTLAEIKQLAMRQITQGGAVALSLNAIAREMGMSGAALYRYFASRDDLLGAIMVDACEDLAVTLEAAAAGPHASAAARFRAVAGAYRAWALAEPYRYRLVFSSPVGSGHPAPESAIPAAQRSIDFFLTVLSAAGGSAGPEPEPAAPPALRTQLEARPARPDAPVLPSAVLLRGVQAWTRLHGVLSLELDGHLIAAGVDPALLYQAEADILVSELGRG